MKDPQSESPFPKKARWRWPEAPKGVSPPADRELRKFRDDFQRVVRQTAGRRQAGWRRRPRPGIKPLAAAAALIALVLLAVLLRDLNMPIEAMTIPGLQGVVVNGATGRALSGVAVTVADDRGDKRYLDFTDAAGFFDVAPPADHQPRQLHFELEGEEVGVLNMGGDREQASGFVRVVLPGPQLEQVTEAEIQLRPGEAAPAEASVQLALVDTAAGPWSGRLVQDPNWPSVFNFGRVLAGIFSARGPASADLSISVRIPAQQLEFNAADPAAVQLIALNATYARKGEYRAYHRGWYITAQPQHDYLPQVDLRHEILADNVTFSWRAEPGVQYALLLPPAAQGELGALEFYDFDSRSDPLFTRIIHHFNLQQPQLSLYRLYYRPAAEGKICELTQQPTTHRLRYALAGETWCAETGEMLPPLCPDDGPGELPGVLWAELYDFTMQNKVAFNPVSVDLPPRANPYGLEFSNAEVGAVAGLRITGADELPAEAIAWDFTDDGVCEAWGQEARVPILYPGSFEVAVYVTEPGGRTVKLTKSIRTVGPASTGWYWEQPIYAGREQLPAEQSTRLALTHEMVANPLPYGYSTGLFAPQVLLIALPDQFAEVPLKELRIYLYGTALAGDVDKVYLAGHFLPLVSADYDHVAAPQYDKEFYQNPAGFEGLDCASVSFVVERALELQAAGEEWRDYLAGRGQIEPVATGFQVFLGLDLANLPPDSELLAALRDFKGDPRFAIRYLTQPDQEVAWHIDLRGGKIRKGGGFIAGVSMETRGLLYNCQWEFQSGGPTPARVEIETEDGEILTGYFDFSQLD